MSRIKEKLINTEPSLLDDVFKGFEEAFSPQRTTNKEGKRYITNSLTANRYRG